MKLKRVHHIKLTVSSLTNSELFYKKILGFKAVAHYPDFIMLFNGYVYLGLTTHGIKRKDQFNEKTIGLDHVSFEVSSREELDEALALFEQENIPHGEIKKLSNNIHVLAFRDPDNIQLELSWKED